MHTCNMVAVPTIVVVKSARSQFHMSVVIDGVSRCSRMRDQTCSPFSPGLTATWCIVALSSRLWITIAQYDCGGDSRLAFSGAIVDASESVRLGDCASRSIG